MYFMTRYKDVYRWAAEKNAAHLHVMTIVTIALLWSVWWYGVYQRYDHMIAAQRKEMAALCARKTEMACITQACCDEQKKIDEIQSRLASYAIATSPVNTAQARMIDLINFSKQTGLSLIGCSMSPPVDKNWQVKQSIHLN